MPLFELRYRGRKETSNGGVRGVHDVLLESDTEDEESALELAHFYLSTLGDPSTRFVFMRPAVAMTTKRMKAMQKAAANGSPESGEDAPTRSAKAGATPGRIGA